MTLTMERIRELHKDWDRETSAFLQLGANYSGPSPFFLQEEKLDAVEFGKMARKWKVPVGELKEFVALQRYINAVANSDCEGLPLPEDIAGHLGISEAVFVDYLHEQVRAIHDAHAEDEGDFVPPWGDAIHEDIAFEDDLKEEAGRGGMAHGLCFDDY